MHLVSLALEASSSIEIAAASSAAIAPSPAEGAPVAGPEGLDGSGSGAEAAEAEAPRRLLSLLGSVLGAVMVGQQAERDSAVELAGSVDEALRLLEAQQVCSNCYAVTAVGWLVHRNTVCALKVENKVDMSTDFHAQGRAACPCRV